MKCGKCGKENKSDARFCNGCGAELKKVSVTKVEKESTAKSNESFDFFNFMINAFLRPSKSFSEEKNKLDDVKTGMIFSGIIAVLMMVVNLVTTMISSVIVKKYSFFEEKQKTEIVFDKLKELPYLELIFKNLLIYAVIILAIAGIFFIGALIAKKSISYIRTLVITALSMIPFITASMFAGSILGLIWEPLGIIFGVAGFVYSIAIFVCLLKDEVTFADKDYSIYYFAGCFTSTIVIAYFVVTKWLASVLATNISGLLK